MKKIIISGANIYNGGKLALYYDCLDCIVKWKYYKKYDITAIVYKYELFEQYSNKITILEFPKERKNYLYRFWYEYFYFSYFFKKESVFIWLSLNDFSPRISAKYQFAYYHNVVPFMKRSSKVFCYESKLIFLSVFWKMCYKLNARSNEAIIIQQEWISDKVRDLMGDKKLKLWVALPYSNTNKILNRNVKSSSTYTFIYPVYPRVFKNFEVICDAANILWKIGLKNFEILFTFNGDENRYAKAIKLKYGGNPCIKFVGQQPRQKLYKEIYLKTNCLIFSSQCESWGVPISEFKSMGKEMLLIDESYAHETLGQYDKVAFFDSNVPSQLADKMMTYIEGTPKYDGNKEKVYAERPCYSWHELWERILCYE